MKKLLYFLVPLTLFALPSNMSVQHGDVDHALDGKAMTLKTGKGAIINWQDFSIQAGESVHIKQAGPKSKVLNRVTGGMRSSIHGHLESNGKVYLVNPAGVLIGPEGHVRCAGFIASTTDIANDEFLRGRNIRKEGLQGEISVLGRIEGPTSLYAKCIKHEGVIDANQVVKKDSKVLIVANNCCEALENPIHAEQVELVAMAAINIDAAAAATASASLDAGTDVTFSTGVGAFDITMDPVSITWSLAPSKLTLDAGRSILLTNASTISCTHTGSGNFDAIEMLANQASTFSVTDGIALNDTGLTISSAEGNILIDGKVRKTVANQRGIGLYAGSVTSTGTGSDSAQVAFVGEGTLIGGGTAGFGIRALLPNDFDITTQDGDISLTGSTTSTAAFPTNSARPIELNHDFTNITSTGTANINFSGVGTGIGLCDAIQINRAGTSATGSGSISLIGRSMVTPASGFTNTGVEMSGGLGGAFTSVTTGDLIIDGRGGLGSNCEGCDLRELHPFGSTSGMIMITGVSPATIAQGAGLEGVGVSLARFNQGVFLTSVSGPIIIDGTSDFGSGIATAGVRLETGAAITSTSGMIDITGVSRSTATLGSGGDGEGILIENSALISNSTGDITLTGTGSSGASATQCGVLIETTSRIVNTSGTTTINGTVPTATPSAGISIISTNAPAALETDTGTITLNGTSDSTMGSSPGLNISSAAIVRTTGAGTINGTSRGALGGADSPGVLVTGAGTTISTTSGTIDLEGIGRSPDADCDGFALIGGATVLGNAGSATIRGTYEGNGSPSSHGVVITGLGSLLSSTSGNANATGTQLASAGPGYGVALIDATPLVTSTSGDITITGIAPNNNLGILVNGGIITNGTGSTLLQTLSDIDVNNGATITSGGPITFNSIRDINVTGSDAVPTITTISSSAPVLLIADRNINIFEGTVTVASISSTGDNLTFVVDDDFPAFPNRGPGQFNLGPNNLITAAGELRVYTVQPSQNTIIAPLNGQLFVPGTFGVNSATEQWVTWFPDGPFGGPNFTIYYKVGVVPDAIRTGQDAIRAGQVAVSELLTDFVPVIQLQPFFSNSGNFVSNYHGKFGVPWEVYRDPRFEPYSSFIFEDTLYYTDR